MNERLATISDALHQTICAHIPKCGDASETRETANRLVQRIVGLVNRENGYRQKDIEGLAERMLALELPPQGLAELQRVLVQELVEQSPVEGTLPSVTSPSRLIADLTTALLRANERVVRREQERKQQSYAAALRQVRRELSVIDAAVESSITAIALWSMDGMIRYVNPALLAMWDYDDRADLIDRHVATLWGDAPPFDTISAFVEQAGGWIGKLKATRQDESTFTTMLAASVVEPKDVAPFVIGSFVDMTYREKLNAMLWNMVDRLKALRQVDSGILAARRPQALADAVLQHIRQLVPCQRASVVLVGAEDEQVEFLAAIPEEAYSVDLERGIRIATLDEILEQPTQDGVHIIDDVLRLPLPEETRERLERRADRTVAVVPLRCGSHLLGALNLAFTDRSVLTDRHISIAQEVADSLAVAIRHARMDQAIDEHRERLRELTARLAEADEAERRRLARDLHDQIGQKLTALGININVIKARVDEKAAPELTSRLEDSLDLLKQTTDRVRRVIADLRPPMLDDYGLLPTLRWCGEKLEARTDIEVILQGKEPSERLPSSIEDTLVRVTQEALTNVAKHAEASRVTIALAETEEAIRLVISDDGTGFNQERIDQRNSCHWGLLTMTERTEAIGGQCRIESDPGEGTRVIVEVKR